MVYQIKKSDLEELRSKLVSVKRKCDKYGCEFNYSEGEPYEKLIKSKCGMNIPIYFVDVEVSGTAIINGWEWVCEIEHTPEGNIIRGAEEVPEYYYTAPGKCDHCGTNHKRKYTYLVKNAEGEYKQVGKACLKDYTGISAEAVAVLLSGYSVAEGYETDPDRGGGCFTPTHFLVEEALSMSIEEIKRHGYTKTFDENGYPNLSNTKEAVLGLLCGRKEFKDFTVEDNLPEAWKMIEYCKNLDGDNNYINNVRTICKNRVVSIKDLGYLVSIPQMYEREMERQRKREEEAKKNAGSNYVGAVGERLTLSGCDIDVLTHWENDFGTTYIYGISNAGNKFTWKTSKYLPLESRRGVKLKGTVKAHTEYRGVKQTELTRCALTK